MIDMWRKGKYKIQRYNNLYMDLAIRISEMSFAKRLQVGCVIVKDDNIISYGWNGMPKGWENDCEIALSDSSTQTRPEVLHAEANALTKLARSNNSAEGAVLYVTHAPCIDCAKLIFQSGIKTVYYQLVYRSEDGIKFLEGCKLDVKMCC